MKLTLNIISSPGPQELKVLVDLAMISGGETDLETARITCLHSSCLGFAPLIFELQATCGFQQLMAACQPVWDAMAGDPALHLKLVRVCTCFVLFVCAPHNCVLDNTGMANADSSDDIVINH